MTGCTFLEPRDFKKTITPTKQIITMKIMAAMAMADFITASIASVMKANGFFETDVDDWLIVLVMSEMALLL